MPYEFSCILRPHPVSILPRSKHCFFFFFNVFTWAVSQELPELCRVARVGGWVQQTCGFSGCLNTFLVLFWLLLLTAKCRSSKDTQQDSPTAPPRHLVVKCSCTCRVYSPTPTCSETPLLTAFKKYFIANCLPKCCTDIETAPRQRQNRRRSQARAPKWR